MRASGAMIEMPIELVGEREAGKKREKRETGQKTVNDISVAGACSVLPPLAPFVFMPSYERIARDVVYCTQRKQYRRAFDWLRPSLAT